MTIQKLLHYATQQLMPIADDPALEAEILFAHALQKNRSYLYAHSEENVSDVSAQNFAHYLQRRCNKEPIAYITGKREFWSLELMVSRDTLIPRPETELLVEVVLKLLPANQMATVADLGTGSGAIALALKSERPLWQIYATDISDNALVIAKKNAQRLGLQEVIFRSGVWCAALPQVPASFDVIVSNPPYVAEVDWGRYADGLAFEPRSALTAGANGLSAILAISQQASRHLKPGAYLVLEHGFTQAASVRDILQADGYKEVTSFCDLAGHERATIGRLLE